ncbi:MAG: hypothetical protein DRJ01_05435 [Bacteroidetes bacterium]|nr:MAG: hypothetical protein DRJ01_05435 [Bacteroidota bacterium]
MKSGKMYSLSKMFDEKKRIIIPDLQRDYCWGNTRNLVSDFFKSLFEFYGAKVKEPISLGLIYAYENPNNLVNIADGQQRITTIYLLLCLIARKLKTPNEKLNNFLVLDNSKNIKEPRLRYEVRESTIYFIKDFINNEIFNPLNLKQESNLTEDYIRNSNWFRDEYKCDPSITSMIEAIKTLDAKINNEKFDDFASFLLGTRNQCKANIGFVYFDVKNREFGEKMYVILNTRGAPMEPNEHIKPLLLEKIVNNDDKIKWAEKWEDWQDFFWQNKNDKDESSDDGFNDFIIWYLKIKNKKEIKKNDIYTNFSKNQNNDNELLEIEKYFQALKNLLGYLKKQRFQDIFNQIQVYDSLDINYLRSLTSTSSEQQQNILIPLLAFMVKFKDNEESAYKFLRRLRKNYFHKENNGRVRTGKYVDWRYILKMIEDSDNLKSLLEFSNFTNFENISDKKQKPKHNDWYDNEEKIKDELKEEYQTEIEYWEDEDDFAGDISPILTMCSVNSESKEISIINSTDIKFDKLKSFFNNYLKLKNSFKTDEPNNYEISNYYRLYRLLIGCTKVGHIYNASSEMEGVCFSKYNLEHLNKIEFYKLCINEFNNYNNIFINKIKFTLSKINKIQNINELTIYWFILKVLIANENKILIADYDGNGVGGYCNLDDNKISKDLPLSFGNIKCGYIIKPAFGKGNRVGYSDKNSWNNKTCLDNPLINIDFELFYENKLLNDDKNKLEKQINESNVCINKILQKQLGFNADFQSNIFAKYNQQNKAIKDKEINHNGSV